MTAPLICFDLGHVLVRICNSWEEACEAAGLEADVETPIEPTDERLGLIHQHEIGALDCDDFFERMAATMRGRHSADEVRRVHEAWILGESDGASDLVRALAERGDVELACLSNTNRTHWRSLERFPSLQPLHHRHASHLLGLRKPQPAIYEEFERLVGRRPEEIVFFDDREDNIEMARRRGWDAQLIDTSRERVPQIEPHLRDLKLL